MNLSETVMNNSRESGWPALTGLDLYGLLPCMLKVPLETEFGRFMQEYGESGSAHFDWQDNLGLMGAVSEGAGPDRLPAVMIWVGNGSLYSRHFMERYVASGRYRSINHPEVNGALASYGLLDPCRNFTMLATDAVVIVADLKLTGTMRLPRRWGDFLEPEYRGSLSLCGRHEAEAFSPPMLLAMQQEFGFDGLRRFARAVGRACHPAQMSKLAGRGKPEGLPFNAVPLFFAETIRDREDVAIIWPEDGALAVPMTMLLRSDANELQQQMAHYFTSLPAARICSSAWFPSLHPSADNRHLPGTGFKWIGWDLLYDPSYGSLLEETLTVFRQAFREHRARRSPMGFVRHMAKESRT